MNIYLIDTEPAGGKGSMARYARLVKESLQPHAESAGLALVPVPLAANRERWSTLPGKFGNWIHHVTVYQRAKRFARKNPPGIYHILDGSHAYIASCFKGSSLIVTAHDIIPLLQLQGRFPTPALGRAARWLINKSIQGLKAADHVIADSHHTAHDLAQHAGVNHHKLSVIPPALVKPKEESMLHAETHASYILHVGHDGFYKNRKGVIRTFSLIDNPPGLRLKMVGPPPNPETGGLIDELGLADRIEFISEATDQELEVLYTQAALLLFPSIYEGFGWPPLEAMACGCPVVCSNAASLPEVVGDAALTARPNDYQALAYHCLELLNDPSLVDTHRNKGYENVKRFTPEKMAEELIQLYEHVMP